MRSIGYSRLNKTITIAIFAFELTFQEHISLKLKLANLPRTAREKYIQKVCEKLGQAHSHQEIANIINRAFQRLDSQKN